MSTDLRMPKATMDYLGFGGMERCNECGRLPSFIKEEINGEESWTVYCKGVNHVVRSIRMPTLREAIEDWNNFIRNELEE